MAVAQKAFANRWCGEVYGLGKWRLLVSGETDNRHQENRIYIIEEKNWRIILYYLEFAQINANYMNLHFLLNQKGPRKF